MYTKQPCCLFRLPSASFSVKALWGYLVFWYANGPLGPEWVGEVISPHPTLGVTYRPGSALKTYYPDNPRGYFEADDPRAVAWWLRVAAEGEATLVMPPDSPDIVRSQ